METGNENLQTHHLALLGVKRLTTLKANLARSTQVIYAYFKFVFSVFLKQALDFHKRRKGASAISHISRKIFETKIRNDILR